MLENWIALLLKNSLDNLIIQSANVSSGFHSINLLTCSQWFFQCFFCSNRGMFLRFEDNQHKNSSQCSDKLCPSPRDLPSVSSTFFARIFCSKVCSKPTLSCQNNVLTKILYVKCWWNWHLKLQLAFPFPVLCLVLNLTTLLGIQTLKSRILHRLYVHTLEDQN